VWNMLKLTEVIRVRVTTETYKRIAAAAIEARRNISDFIRITVESAISKNGGQK
jgi:uncharacterized protein (DUF1778 family)